jgi:hypothetical protein
VKPPGNIPFITSVVDSADQVRRDRRLTSREQAAKGKRGQPPQTERIRRVIIYVEHLENEGVPFATARNSIMNKRVREWINGRMKESNDPRKSRRGTISADAVTDLLKQMAALRH